MVPGTPFPWGWYGVELMGYRTGTGLFPCYPHDSLPSIPVRLDGSFDWLRTAPDHKSSAGSGNEEPLRQLLSASPTGLPEAFITFFRSPVLGRKFRPGLGCYFDVDSESIAIRKGLGWLVRFVTEEQGCIFWNLHIHPDEVQHSVVATRRFSGSDGSRPSPKDITTVAASFEEFIFRFWLENELWYALNAGGPMPEYGEAYLDHYRKAAGG